MNVKKNMQTNRIKRVLLNLKITSHMSSVFNTAESKIISAFLCVFHGLSIIKCKVKGARCSFSVWPLAGSKPPIGVLIMHKLQF